MHILHAVGDQPPHGVHFILGYFEDQFVVHLEQHSGAQLALAQLGVNANHGNLDEVGGSSLQRRVHRGALGKAAQVAVLAVDVGDGTHAPKQRCHFLIAARLVQGCVDEAAHPAVLLEIGIDEALGFLGVNAELLRQSER